MNTVLVDDHLLLRVLLDQEPEALRPDGAVIATTGLWYHRLCRALANDSVVGSMSRRLGGVEPTVGAGALAAVIELPPQIELVSLRTLSWPMGRLPANGARLNLLSLEAIAAARHLSADICLSEEDENAPLLDTAVRFDVTVRVIATNGV